LAGLIALVTILAAGLLTVGVADGRWDAFDAAVRAAVAGLRTDAGLRAMVLVSHMSSEHATPVIIIVLGWLIMRRYRRFAAHFVIVAGTSTVWQIALKRLIGRPRPLPPLVPNWYGPGYPSGHTLTAVVLALLLLLYIEHLGAPAWRWPPLKIHAARAAIIAWPLVVSLSRVYIEAHWTIDILGGLLIAVAHFMTWYYFLGWRVIAIEQQRS
jgi:membrane-associated phospholipid phosphatase